MKTTVEKFQTPKVILISFAHLIHDVYTSFLSPLLPMIIEKLSLTLSQAGLLSTVMQIPALANPFIGLFADNKGLARWLVILTPSITALPMCLMGAASSYWQLLVLCFVTGISVALFHVPSPVLVANYSGGMKGRGMSFYMTGGEAARSLGPLLAVASVHFLGLENLYWVMAIALATSVLLWLNLEKQENSGPMKKRGSLTASYKEIRHVLNPLVGVLTARGFMHAAMGTFLTVYVENKTGNLWFSGAALAIYEGLGVAGALSAGTLSDWMGRRRVLLWATLVAPFFVLLFVFTTGIFQIIALCVVGFTVLSTTPVMLALVQETALVNPAAGNGLFMMCSFIIRSIAVVIVGVVGDVGGLDAMFLFSAGAGFLGLPFLLKLEK
ncbi:MAG: MFS transporter [Desulfovibrionales bacterium]|nr:MFS transporter [Desulfovibrionales bacterium]